MAITPRVAGACLIRIATLSSASGALQSLGYTRNYGETRKEAFHLDIPGDERGGDDGPPIDIQYLGEIAIVRLELTKWDDTVANLVRARVDGATAGQPAAAGSLMFSAALSMRLLLHSPIDPRNFPVAIPRNPIEIGRGTKYSSLICEFECHKNDGGILYNAVTT